MNRQALIMTLSAGLAGTAGAQNIVGPAFEVVAQNDTGTATFSVDPFSEGFYIPGQGQYIWSFAQFVPGGVIELRDDNTNALVALLTNGVIAIQDGTTGENPSIGMAFAVVAGSTDTTFRIESGLSDNADLPIAAATASAGLTLTDTDGDGSASLTGALPDGSVFEANANGSRFTGLLSSLSVNIANDSNDVNDAFPGNGIFTQLGAPLETMSTALEFTVSAFDTASGTNAFGAIPIPSPAGAAVLALGGLAMGRRR